MLKIRTARQTPNMSQRRINSRPRSCYGAVDPLKCQQQRPFHTARIADSLKRGLQGFVILKPGKMIERGNNDFRHGPRYTPHDCKMPAHSP